MPASRPGSVTFSPTGPVEAEKVEKGTEQRAKPRFSAGQRIYLDEDGNRITAREAEERGLDFVHGPVVGDILGF